MDKDDARHYIEFAIVNKLIMGPNQVRYLYECAEYPVPPHLIPEILTDEEKEKRYEMGRRLFEKTSFIPQSNWTLPESFDKNNLMHFYRECKPKGD